MEHLKGITAIANPLVNSYKRLVPGYEAPVYIAWSESNRSPSIRIPAVRGKGTRIELRSPDSASNPYLVIAVCLAAGLEGIRKEITPPAPVEQNIFHMNRSEMEEMCLEAIPGDLHQAVEALKQDSFIQQVLGEHLTRKYVEAKEKEWDAYQNQVTQWELDEYLYRI